MSSLTVAKNPLDGGQCRFRVGHLRKVKGQEYRRSIADFAIITLQSHLEQRRTWGQLHFNLMPILFQSLPSRSSIQSMLSTFIAGELDSQMFELKLSRSFRWKQISSADMRVIIVLSSITTVLMRQLETSTSFFKAMQDPTLLSPILDQICSAGADTCLDIMNQYAIQIDQSGTCKFSSLSVRPQPMEQGSDVHKLTSTCSPWQAALTYVKAMH